MDEMISFHREDVLETLRQRNLEGKRAVIADLHRRGSPQAMKILVDVLEDDSWYLRELAVKALADAGDEVAPAILALLESGLWYTRAAAARALGKMGHAPSLPRLVDVLADSNRTVQGAALASIADLVRAGAARETAREFWGRGARRAQELNHLLQTVHPDAGNAVAEHLADPSSFLKSARETTAPAADSEEEARKNA
jgi:HEAT repeat protein